MEREREKLTSYYLQLNDIVSGHSDMAHFVRAVSRSLTGRWLSSDPTGDQDNNNSPALASPEIHTGATHHDQDINWPLPSQTHYISNTTTWTRLLVWPFQFRNELSVSRLQRVQQAVLRHRTECILLSAYQPLIECKAFLTRGGRNVKWSYERCEE